MNSLVFRDSNVQILLIVLFIAEGDMQLQKQFFFPDTLEPRGECKPVC